MIRLKIQWFRLGEPVRSAGLVFMRSKCLPGFYADIGEEKRMSCRSVNKYRVV